MTYVEYFGISVRFSVSFVKVESEITTTQFRTTFNRRKSDNVEIPGKSKGRNFLPNAWPYFQEPQDGEVGHVGEVGHGHGQVVLHTHLVEADRFWTDSLILKSFLILIILLLLL